MVLSLESAEIGNIYCNISFKKDALGGKTVDDFLNLIKTIPLTWGGKEILIPNYRFVYLAEKTFCIEGAEIVFK